MANKPRSFREFSIPLMGCSSVRIAGLANPIRYNNSYESVLDYLQQKGFEALISVDEPQQSIPGLDDYQRIGKYWKTKCSGEHYYIHYPDPLGGSGKSEHLLTISDFDNLFSYVRESIANNRSIAIHCGAGYGRTGTMLAALALYSELEKIYNADPVEFQQYDIDDSSQTITTGHSGMPIHCSKALYRSIMLVRSLGQYSPQDSSVETEGQIKALIQLEKHLIDKFKQDPPVPVPVKSVREKPDNKFISILKSIFYPIIFLIKFFGSNKQTNISDNATPAKNNSIYKDISIKDSGKQVKLNNTKASAATHEHEGVLYKLFARKNKIAHESPESKPNAHNPKHK